MNTFIYPLGGGETLRRKNNALREKLLACAQQLTEEGGAQAVSMRALAVRAGTATGTVYTTLPIRMNCSWR